MEHLANGKVALHCGDCIEVMASLPENSIDSIVCDPPYHLISIVKRFGKEGSAPPKEALGEKGAFNRSSRGFMNTTWDGGDVAFRPETWAAALRVLKPGGHLVAFSGTRTYHRMTCAIEDGGFEIRDQLAWVYGSGFPKSHSVSKNIDSHFRRKWLKLVEEASSVDVGEVTQSWQEFSNTANGAGISFQKDAVIVGTNTKKSAFAAANVLLPMHLEKSNADAITAELKCSAQNLMSKNAAISVRANVENNISDLNSTAHHAESVLANHNVVQSSIKIIIARKRVAAWLKESTSDSLKGAEVLRTWLGSEKSSKPEISFALCAALANDLKHIILNQSESFRNLDTKSQTDFVCATTVIITESMAECLISFTADTLKSAASRQADKCERRVVSTRTMPDMRNRNGAGGQLVGSALGFERGTMEHETTQAATALAAEWEGWGTALKPAWEPICLARKPLIGTVVETVMMHRTGGIHIDACRVECDDKTPFPVGATSADGSITTGLHSKPRGDDTSKNGRFPANLLHDGSAEVLAAFPETSPGSGQPRNNTTSLGSSGSGIYGMAGAFTGIGHEDNGGSAARFFYSAKADADDRLGSKHPTIKPVDLMQWLVRLVTPKGGTVLDCFAGTGTTGEAAFREGMKAILIEREIEYIRDIRRRMELVLGGRDERKRASLKASGKMQTVESLPLFSVL